MKKLLLLTVLCSLMIGCATKDEPQVMDFEGQQIDTVGVGESCAQKSCHRGLECDKDFTCVDHVIDPNMVCPETHSPVCAQRDGRKNGYLNECEARRHGAKVLYEGFCKVDESVAGDCEAKVISMGNCKKLFVGYEYDGSTCVEQRIGGCEADIPFTSLEACQNKCQ